MTDPRCRVVARVLAVAGALAPAIVSAAAANEPVAELNVGRYVGMWHEIAHLPMYFQRQCVDSITATYTARGDGTIDVRNACRTRDGDRDEALGRARPVEGRPGAFEVRFAPAWLGWLPFIWADYWVVDLDPEYRWAVVGGPNRKYLWILARDPSISPELYETLKSRAAERGYPVDALIVTGGTK